VPSAEALGLGTNDLTNIEKVEVSVA